ncbi:MAG: hypothetical protein K2X27_26075, partial [Candidatus Obscuribacterales bacterium]|nr:hypothetical protein [Candidatus Obscuribacterales bacterium]
MAKNRKGAVLPIIIALIFIIILIGVFAVIALQLLEAGRETNTAADSGGLNVARVALVAPTIQLNPNDATYGDVDSTIQNVVLKGSRTVNLLNFNRIVAWGLMVAMNADAEGNTKAISSAKKVWMRIEGDQTRSLGAQLKNVLSNPKTVINSNSPDIPSGVWPKTVFNATALRNPTLLANPDQTLVWKSFETGYLGAGDSTNVVANTFLDGMPYSDLGSLTRYKITIPATEDGYVQGYKPIKIGNTGITYYFVTVYRKLTPGLRTEKDFRKNLTQPGSGTVALPPNTFLNHADIIVKKTNTVMSAGSPATVGCKPYAASCNLPGYFVFENGPALTYKGKMVSGQENYTKVTVPGLTANEFVKDTGVDKFIDLKIQYKRNPGGDSGPLAFDNITSGLGQYFEGSNPIATPDKNYPWGTFGYYSSGIDQAGYKFCCPGANYVYKELYGKITKPALNPGDAVTQTTAATFSWLKDGSNQGRPTQDPQTIAYNFFVQRGMQLGAVKEDLDYVWLNLYLDLDDKIYVWVDDDTSTIVSRTPP